MNRFAIASAAVSAVLAFGSAQANTFSGGAYDDQSPYQLLADSFNTGVGTSFNLTGGTVNFESNIDFDSGNPTSVNAVLKAIGGSTTLYTGTVNGSGANYTFSFSGVSQGAYDLWFIGASTHASLLGAGSYSVTAVPEPETSAMMLAGLGALGFLVRRRKQG